MKSLNLKSILTIFAVIVLNWRVNALVVTNINDSGVGSLRWAVDNAITGELITFDPSIANQTINLIAEITPATEITIDGEDKNMTVSGSGVTRLFDVSGAVTFTVRDITFTEGSSGTGALIYSTGGCNIMADNVVFKNSTVSNDGGAIRALGGTHTYKNCAFIGNSGGSWGGAYYSLFATTTFENCLFAGNRCSSGGAMFIRGTTHIYGCTFAGNYATGTNGGALYVRNGQQVNIYNSIFWNNLTSVTGPGDINNFFTVESGSTIDMNVTSSIIEGSGGSAAWNPAYGTNNGGNLDLDPIFVNPQAPASAPTTAGSYELDFGSNAQDVGNNGYAVGPTELKQAPRIVYGIVDMGCYELCRTVGSESPVVCAQYTSPSGNYVWNTSGIYSDTLANFMGCDSVITVNLTVLNTFNTINPVVCDTYTMPSGGTQNTSGVYMDTIPNMSGCDSIITVNLTVNYESTSTINPTACYSYTSPSGNYTWTSSGSYNDTIPNALGCDSVITVNLAINTTYSSFPMAGCDSVVSPSGIYTWYTSGVYNDTIPNSLGCDSVMTITTTVDYASSNTINPVVCYTYTSPSTNYTWTSSGVYSDTLTNAAGCDSVITVNLTVHNETYATINPAACYSYTSPSGAYVWSSTGSYNDTIPNANGCDSVITVNLTINSETYNTISPTVCESYVSPSGSYVWTSSGSYNDTIPNYLGCDSVITVNLTVNYHSASSITEVHCESFTSPSGLYTWTTSGNYNDTIPNVTGCDSVITVDLTIHYNTTATINPVDCASYTSPSGLYTWTNSGTYNDTIPNSNGCDSLLTINLTLNNSYESIVETRCDSLVSPSGLYVWTQSGIYLDTIPNSNGCDSIITVDATIYHVDTVLSVAANTITADQSADAYQWFSCEGDSISILTEEFGYQINLNISGYYGVIIEEFGCIDTTSCVWVEIPFEPISGFTPNGDGVNDVFVINIDNPDNEVVIFNRWGDEVARFTGYNNDDVAWDGTNKYGEIITGTYYYVITTNTTHVGWVQVLK